MTPAANRPVELVITATVGSPWGPTHDHVVQTTADAVDDVVERFRRDVGPYNERIRNVLVREVECPM